MLQLCHSCSITSVLVECKPSIATPTLRASYHRRSFFSLLISLLAKDVAVCVNLSASGKKRHQEPIELNKMRRWCITRLDVSYCCSSWPRLKEDVTTKTRRIVSGDNTVLVSFARNTAAVAPMIR